LLATTIATDLRALLWVHEEIVERGKRKCTVNNNNNNNKKYSQRAQFSIHLEAHRKLYSRRGTERSFFTL
jgi:hypothetical protein